MRNNNRRGQRGQNRSSNQWEQRSRDNQGRFTDDRFYNRFSGMRSSEDRYPYSHEWYEGSNIKNDSYDRNNYGRGRYENGSYDESLGRGYGNDPESFESSYDRGNHSINDYNNSYGGSMRDGNGYGNNRNSDVNHSTWDRGDHGSTWGNSSRDSFINHRGKGPKGYQRSDDRIREDINDRLSDDHEIDASDIEVKVEKGEVTLSGSVSDRDAKRKAEDLVEAVSGVKNVENRIRITGNNSNSSREENSRVARSNDRSKIRESVS